jgi:HAD superfamily hydrolase (TIGR01509 family)
MVKCILYDLGDILFEAHFWRKWMWKYFLKNSYYKEPFPEFYDYYEENLMQVYKGGEQYWVAYNSMLDDLKLKEKHEFVKFSKYVKHNIENNRELYPHVAETISYLQLQGIKNVILSDNERGGSYIRQSILKKFNVESLIDMVVTSKDMGVTKPANLMYKHALKAYGIRNNEAIFVGHDCDEIRGAAKCGIATIEFNNYLNRETNADFKIKKFSEIKTIVGQLNYSLDSELLKA